MQKIIIVLTLGISLFCLTPPPALGQEFPHYFTFRAGTYSPTGDLDDFDFDPGFNGEIAYGYSFNPYLALEGGIGHFDTEFSLSGFDLSAGFFTIEEDVRVTPVTCTLKGIIPTAAVEFYGGAGLGVYFAEAEGDLTSFSLAITDSYSDNDVVAGVHFVLGINVNVAIDFFLGLEAKYILTDDAEFVDDTFNIPVPWETNLDGYTITGTAGFRF